MRSARVLLVAFTIFVIAPPSLAWEFEVFETRGSAYERGFQHGQHFKDEIQKDFKTKGGWGWSVGLINRTPPMLAHFLIKIRELPHGQEFIDEMQGIADGSGIPFNDIAGLNLTFDLGERTACSMAILPSGPDGPILVNTLDDFTTGKTNRNYPCFIHVAYPTDGHAMISLCNFGTVWAHQGLSDAGLAVGSTSGGLGFPRGGANYDGVYYAILHRYALQFFEHADEAIKLYADHRQISKGINLSVLDKDGNGAMVEFASRAVGVRKVGGEKSPIYCTNFFQTDAFPKYDPSIETYDYMKNARARYARFDELIGPKAPKAPVTDLAFAKNLVHDENGGKQGQIRQDNNVMITAVANVWSCKSTTGYCYTQVLASGEPHVIKLDPAKKPSTGKPAPKNDAMTAVLTATPPKIGMTYVQLKEATVTKVDPDGMTLGFTHADKPMRAELSAAQVMLYTSGTLAGISPDTLTVCTGKKSADGSSIEADEIVTFQPKRSPVGRWIGTELSGSLQQHGDELSVVFDPTKPPVKVTLAKGCRISVATKVKPADALKPGQTTDIFGYVLFDGDVVHSSYLLIRNDLTTSRKD